jgi:8-amino-7-oxononanoate synthase
MPVDLLQQRIDSRLSSRGARNILRHLSDPIDLIDFSSNDYLGFSTHPDLRKVFLQRLASQPQNNTSTVLGAGGSRLLDGNKSAHIELERRAERFFRSSPGGALLHNSGYDANVGLFSCLPQDIDYIVYDALIHASVHDGMRASRTPASSRIAFDHNSVHSLQSILIDISEKDERVRNGVSCIFIAVEALYSMDGDLAPLDRIVDVVEYSLPLRNGYLIVDEAHSTGIYGKNGRGLVSMLGLEDKILVRLHTFGKALASNGGMYMPTPYNFDTSLRRWWISWAMLLIIHSLLSCALDHAWSARIPYQLLEALDLQYGPGEL